MKIFVSKYFASLKISEGKHLLSHAFLGNRQVVSDGTLAFIQFFRTGKSEEEAEGEFGQNVGVALKRIMDSGLLVPEDSVQNEEKKFLPLILDAGALRDSSRVSRGRDRGLYATIDVGDYAEIKAECSIGLIAECFLERTGGLLPDLGLKHGIRIKTHYLSGIDSLNSLPRLDLIIFRKANGPAIASFYDAFYLRSKLEVEDRMGSYLQDLRRQLTALHEQTEAVILVHTLPIPSVSPMGPWIEGHAENGLVEAIGQLNTEIKTIARSLPRCFVFDEDFFLGNLGRVFCLDSSVAVLAHLGPLEMWSSEQGDSLYFTNWVPADSFDVPRVHYLENALAENYLAFIKILKGVNKRKIVITDLDNTLWPGIIGEENFSMSTVANYYGAGGFYAGVHQALKFLKARGILLAIASKNNESDVLEKWKFDDAELEDRLCTLNDFVTRRINWDPKVQNISDILEEVGLTPDSAVFIDDNPVERERVRTAFPEMLILGGEPEIRHSLLTLPELQSLRMTDESVNRTEMVKAQVQRKRFTQSFQDEDTSLRNLNLQFKIERALTPQTLDRVQELFMRTNQFNTTAIRYTQKELLDLTANPDNSIFILYLKDRFTYYGLVGICLCESNAIVSFVLSCRVLSLQAEHLLLRYAMAALDSRKKYSQIIGCFLPTKKNFPASKLYASHHYQERADGKWVYSLDGSSLPPLPEFYSEMK